MSRRARRVWDVLNRDIGRFLWDGFTRRHTGNATWASFENLREGLVLDTFQVQLEIMRALGKCQWIDCPFEPQHRIAER
jgi:hypothetical protein